MTKTLWVIAGPTAVGKTAHCVALAKALHTEVISADSRQFYRELSIGTAKPKQEELQGIPHHFIDSHSIFDAFSPGDFEREALEVLKVLFKTKDTVLATGGSGLYIKALMDGLDDMPEADLALRAVLNQRYQAQGLEGLVQELKDKDPVYAQQVDLKNPQRVIRALEVCLSTGKPFSSFRLQQKKTRPFQVRKTCLYRERSALYARIDARMDDMLANGLVEEAKAWYAHRDLYALKTIGYKEVFGYLDGAYNAEEMQRLLKRNSRHYAKKQETWFRHQGDFDWEALA